MNENIEQQLISDYLGGNLSNEDLAFLKEAEKNHDPIIDKLKVSKELVAGLRVARKNDLKAEFGQMLNKHKESKKSKKKVIPLYYGIAASFLLIAAAIYLFNFSNNEIGHDQLFISYYQPMTTLSANRGDSDHLSSGLKYYNGEEYLAASKVFEKNLLENKNDVFSKILLGNCYLNLAREKEAISIFESTKNVKDAYYSNYSFWYLSLAYLKEGKIARCQENLSLIISGNMIHAKEAEKLLVEIN